MKCIRHPRHEAQRHKFASALVDGLHLTLFQIGDAVLVRIGNLGAEK
ncbi:hypothetical protein SDC9_171527 [bioreactor metagenome]|uniref:Uncharacterized protein n=1 Tax=bioreactor metagenome TaxID=1076179 RepID=A0A645GK93_9ZZZZ